MFTSSFLPWNSNFLGIMKAVWLNSRNLCLSSLESREEIFDWKQNLHLISIKFKNKCVSAVCSFTGNYFGAVRVKIKYWIENKDSIQQFKGPIINSLSFSVIFKKSIKLLQHNFNLQWKEIFWCWKICLYWPIMFNFVKFHVVL